MSRFVKKNRILICAEAFLCLFLLVNVLLRDERLVQEVTGEQWVANYEETGVAKVGDITLTPGMYLIRVTTDGLSETVQVALKSEQSAFKTLRTNEVNVQAGNPFVEFEAYALAKVESVYLELSGTDADMAQIASVALYETPKGFGILLFCALFGFGILNFLIWFRGEIMAGNISRQQQMIFWGICGAVAISYIPFATDYFFMLCDSPFHVTRIEGLAETLKDGVFPVRVQSYWLSDHGYATSMFYGDILLYIPALLRIMGFSLVTSYKIFLMIVMVATAAVCYYAVKKCTGNKNASCVATIYYVLAPYRLYNVYCRDSMGEYLAMLFFPLVICGIYSLLREDIHSSSYKKAKWPLIIGLCGLLNCHMLSTELTLIFLVFTCVFAYRKVFRKETFFQLVQAAVICLTVTCWYWVPFLWMFTHDTYALSNIVSKNIQEMGTWFAGIFQMVPYKGQYQIGMQNCEPIQLGVAGIVLLLCFGGFQWIFSAHRKERRNTDGWKQTVLFALLTVVTLILSTKYFPWDFISSIKGIGFLANALQFPTRFLALSTVFCAFFTGFFVCWLQEAPEKFLMGLSVRLKQVLVAFIVMLCVVSAVFQTGNICIDARMVRVYAPECFGTVFVGNGEYLLSGVSVQDYYYHDPVAEDGLTYSEYEKNGTTITIRLENDTETTKHIELPLTGYLGYSISSVAGDLGPYITEERGNHQDLRIAVPAGFSDRIRVSYTGPVYFKIADWISAISILFLLMKGISGRVKQWNCAKKSE